MISSLPIFYTANAFGFLDTIKMELESLKPFDKLPLLGMDFLKSDESPMDGTDFAAVTDFLETKFSDIASYKEMVKSEIQAVKGLGFKPFNIPMAEDFDLDLSTITDMLNFGDDDALANGFKIPKFFTESMNLTMFDEEPIEDEAEDIMEVFDAAFMDAQDATDIKEFKGTIKMLNTQLYRDLSQNFRVKYRETVGSIVQKIRDIRFGPLGDLYQQVKNSLPQPVIDFKNQVNQTQRDQVNSLNLKVLEIIARAGVKVDGLLVQKFATISDICQAKFTVPECASIIAPSRSKARTLNRQNALSTATIVNGIFRVTRQILRKKTIV